MSNTAYYAWLVRGLGGIANLLKRVSDEGIQIDDHWQKELEKEVFHLVAVNNVQRLGANLPALTLAPEGVQRVSTEPTPSGTASEPSGIRGPDDAEPKAVDLPQSGELHKHRRR